MKPRRSLIALVAALVPLAACTTSNPPTAELTEEIIDSLGVTDDEKVCMYDVVEGFTLTDAERLVADDLGAAADKVADGSPEAQAIIDRFQSELASCRD